MYDNVMRMSTDFRPPRSTPPGAVAAMRTSPSGRRPGISKKDICRGLPHCKVRKSSLRSGINSREGAWKEGFRFLRLDSQIRRRPAQALQKIQCIADLTFDALPAVRAIGIDVIKPAVLDRGDIEHHGTAPGL